MNLEQLSAELFWWGMGLSVLAFVATLVGVPWMVGRLPRDYFSRPERTAWRQSAWRRSADGALLGTMLALGKNLLGVLLILMGLVMLVTPGQGVITILIGVLLLNFPGKHRLVRWLVLRPGVLRGLNWLRRRRRQPPFRKPR